MFLFHLKKPVPQSTCHPICWTFSSLTAAAVPHPSNVMAIQSTTFNRENGKDILCRGGIIKAFILAEMAKFLLNYDNTNLTAVLSHTRPPTIFFPFRKLRFGGRQSNVSMTITACGVSRTTISMSIVRGFELLFHLYWLVDKQKLRSKTHHENRLKRHFRSSRSRAIFWSGKFIQTVHNHNNMRLNRTKYKQ